MLNLISSFLATLVLTIVFLFIGGTHLRRIFSVAHSSEKESNIDYLFIGSSYFLGLVIVVGFFRVIEYWSGNAALICKITVVFLIIYSLMLGGFAQVFRSIVKVLKNRFLIGACLTLVLLLYSYWLSDYPISVNWHLTSLHAGRYSNISTFIVQNNYIPIFGQNFGQSVVAALPAFLFGANKYYPNLFFALVFSIFFLSLILIGSLRETFNIKSASSVFVCLLIVMLGNTALSVTHVLVLNSGSPTLLNGYSDSITGLATTFLFFNLVMKVYESSDTLIREKQLLIYLSIFLIGVHWSCSSPEAALVTIPASVVVFLFGKTINKDICGLILCCTSGIFFGSQMGGTFTPKFLQEAVSISGVVAPELMQSWEVFPEATPWVMYIYPIGATSTFGEVGSKIPELTGSINTSKLGPLASQIYLKLFILQQTLWDALRIFFFPVLGLIVYFFSNYLSRENNTCKKFFSFALTTFVLGFCANFFLSNPGVQKWDQSRFMTSGNFFAMLLFSVALTQISTGLKIKKKVFIFFLIFIFCILGPLSNLLIGSIDNIFSGSSPWARLIMTSDHVGYTY